MMTSINHRFDLGNLLSKGRFSLVYEAFDKKKNRNVIAKLVRNLFQVKLNSSQSNMKIRSTTDEKLKYLRRYFLSQFKDFQSSLLTGLI